MELIGEGYHVVVRLGNLEDSALIRKQLGDDHAILVASASYLKHMGTPKRLGDLKNHRFLVMGTPATSTFVRLSDRVNAKKPSMWVSMRR